MKRMITAIFILFFGLTFNAMAAPSGGSGGEGLKETCELSGGTFTGSESGNWACCWDNWGCYGCVDGNCKIKCNTARCRKANGIGSMNPSTTPPKGAAIIDGLAPAGMKAPVAPVKRNKAMQMPMPSTNQVE